MEKSEFEGQAPLRRMHPAADYFEACPASTKPGTLCVDPVRGCLSISPAANHTLTIGTATLAVFPAKVTELGEHWFNRGFKLFLHPLSFRSSQAQNSIVQDF